MFYFSGSSLAHRQGVDKRLIELSDRAIEISVIDFGIPETGGVRSAETQNQLYHEGLSRADGYEKLSKHQLGKALDFYAYVDGQASWQKEHMAMVAAAFLQAAVEMGIKVKWGGLWRSWADYPHVELVE